MKKQKKPAGYLVLAKKIRNDWGGVKPYTRVQMSAKIYNRKKAKITLE